MPLRSGYTGRLIQFEHNFERFNLGVVIECPQRAFAGAMFAPQLERIAHVLSHSDRAALRRELLLDDRSRSTAGPLSARVKRLRSSVRLGPDLSGRTRAPDRLLTTLFNRFVQARHNDIASSH